MKLPEKKTVPSFAVSGRDKKSNHVFSEKFYSYIIVIFTFLSYGNSLQNQYSFDDNLITPIHQQVQKGVKGIPEIFSSYYVLSNKNSNINFEYRPLAKATFALEYEFFGKNPEVSHFINIILYCLTCFLLYRLAISIFPRSGKLFAFIAILLFAVHPAHTEAVNSLKNREELLAFLFCIFSIIFFLNTSKTNNYFFFIPGIIFFILALLTKLTAVPFLIIIPLCVFYVCGKNYKNILFSFLCLSVVLIVFLAAVKIFLPGVHERQVFFIENPIVTEKSFYIIILNSLQTMALYLKLYFFPHPLSFYYGYNMFPVPQKISSEIIFSFLLHGFLFIFSVLKLRKRSTLSFAFLFYLINMSMYYNLVYPSTGIIADRALYISSFGFSLFISFFIMKLNKKLMIFSILVCLLIPASAKTILRNKDWKNNYTLMSKDIAHLKHSAKANMEFALLLKDKWQNEKDAALKEQYAGKSIFYYNESLKIKPDMATPHNEIGKILFNQFARYAEAKEHFLKAIELLDSRAEYYFNLATAELFLNNYEDAEIIFLKTLQLEPNYTKAMHNLFLIYMEQKKFEKAFQINSLLMEKTPDDAYPYFNFGKYYLANGDTSNSIIYFEKANAIHPGNEEILSILKQLKN